MKPSVYIETSVVSYLTNRRSRDIITAAHQESTNSWWENEASAFKLVVSELVLKEAGAGDAAAAATRLAAIADLPILTVSTPARRLTEQFISVGPLPRSAAVDAAHLALAAVNGIDYLLTWNCRHLANALYRSRFEVLVRNAGYACPVICTPDELMEA